MYGTSRHNTRGIERPERIGLRLPAEVKARWQAAADERHWTLTVLIEQAVERYLRRSPPPDTK